MIKMKVENENENNGFWKIERRNRGKTKMEKPEKKRLETANGK